MIDIQHKLKCSSDMNDEEFVDDDNLYELYFAFGSLVPEVLLPKQNLMSDLILKTILGYIIVNSIDWTKFEEVENSESIWNSFSTINEKQKQFDFTNIDNNEDKNKYNLEKEWMLFFTLKFIQTNTI
jgi:hypothetical protein